MRVHGIATVQSCRSIDAFGYCRRMDKSEIRLTIWTLEKY